QDGADLRGDPGELRLRRGWIRRLGFLRIPGEVARAGALLAGVPHEGGAPAFRPRRALRPVDQSGRVLQRRIPGTALDRDAADVLRPAAFGSRAALERSGVHLGDLRSRVRNDADLCVPLLLPGLRTLGAGHPVPESVPASLAGPTRRCQTKPGRKSAR